MPIQYATLFHNNLINHWAAASKTEAATLPYTIYYYVKYVLFILREIGSAERERERMNVNAGCVCLGGYAGGGGTLSMFTWPYTKYII